MKKTYQWQANSNAAPFCSSTSQGFIEADSPMKALKDVVKNYKHPAGLYAATINECTPGNKMAAQYLSSKAATSEDAACEMHQQKADGLYVNGKKAEIKPERYETF